MRPRISIIKRGVSQQVREGGTHVPHRRESKSDLGPFPPWRGRIAVVLMMLSVLTSPFAIVVEADSPTESVDAGTGASLTTLVGSGTIDDPY
jgi:hypothetical protein